MTREQFLDKMPEDELSSRADDILVRVCKMVIKRLNKKLDAEYADCNGIGCPDSFNFFDMLSISWQSCSFDEINPYLQDTIEDYLDVELEKVKGLDKSIIYRAFCNEEDDDLVDDANSLNNELYDTFMRLLDDHYYLRKIQNYVERI